MADTVEVANATEISRKSKSKVWYDKKSRSRLFDPGQLVLMFTTIPVSSLDAKYEGPYEVLETVDSVEYIISTPDKHKKKQLVHVNLLKQYYSRDNPRYVLTARSVENDKKCYNLFMTKMTCDHLETEQLHFYKS